MRPFLGLHKVIEQRLTNCKGWTQHEATKETRLKEWHGPSVTETYTESLNNVLLDCYCKIQMSVLLADMQNLLQFLSRLHALPTNTCWLSWDLIP